MTTIPAFAATHSRAKLYHQAHASFMEEGRRLNGTGADQRAALPESTQFRSGVLDVYTNHDKQQVVLVEKLTGDEIDGTFITQESQRDVALQVYRQVMKPNKWGVLEVRERVDNRDAGGRLLNSWQREVESDPGSQAFFISIPD